MCHLNAYDDYKRLFLAGDFQTMARLSGSELDPDGNCMIVSYFNRNCRVDLASGEITAGEFIPGETDKIIIWNYLVHSKGEEPAGKWVGFAEVPNARNHQQMFKRNSVELLARTFGTDPEGFSRAAEALGGEVLKMGNLGFGFKVFPKLLVAVSLYLADEEFPASANMVFDAAVVKQLDVPNIYTLGCEIARKLCSSGVY